MTSLAINIGDNLLINAVVWIRSLPDDELGPTRRILDDLNALTIAGGLPVIEYHVSGASELHTVLFEIAEKARQGLRPILHFDAHGGEEQGLLLAPTGEHVTWDLLVTLIRAINVATENNLVCVFAFCFGLELYRRAEISKPVPAYLFIAPEKKIEVGFLEEKTALFYRELNRLGNITASFEASLIGPMRSLNCQALFLQSLIKYVTKFCIGKGKIRRQERLLTQHLQELGVREPTKALLSATRKKLKAALTPGQGIIDHYAPTFLVGRPAGFDYAQVQKFLDWRHAKNRR